MATSFVSPGMAPPYAAQLQQLAREQQLLDQQSQEQAQGLTPGLVDTGRLKVLNFNGLANALAKRRTGQDQALNLKRQADVQGAYQKDLVQQLKAFRTAEAGTPETALPGPGAPLEGREGPGPSAPGVPADPMAYRGFLDSHLPEVRAAAQEKQKLQDALFAKLAERASMPSVQAAAGSRDVRQLAPMPKDMALDGALVRTAEGQKPTLAPGTGFKQVTLADGTVVNQNLLTGKQDSVNRAPSMRTDVNLPGNKVIDTMIKGLPDDLKAATAANSAIRGTETALDALGKGARAGFGEEFLQNARTLTSGLTGIQFDSTTPTGVLAKALAKNVIDELGGLGAQISNTDREFMATAVGGLNTDPTALERILAIRLAALQKTVDKHNQDVEALAGNPKNDAGDFTRQKFALPRNRVTVKFNSPEAEASYVSGQLNIGYEDALKKVQAMRKEDAPKGDGDPRDPTSPAGKARLKSLLGDAYRGQ